MERNNAFKGKLGFDGQFTDALSRATPIIIDTFEDHGHDVHTFVSRSASAVSMDLDQFAVELRYRPRMRRGWKAPQCSGDMLELRLEPLYPEVCDTELSEMLLAALLHNLVVELDVTSVKWLEAPALLTRNQFLSAFETIDFDAFDTSEDARVPQPAPGSYVFSYANDDDFSLWDSEETVTVLDQPTTRSADRLSPAITAHDRAFVNSTSHRRVGRPRGRSVFAPVDVTVRALETHCDEILMASYIDLDETAMSARASVTDSAYAQPSSAKSWWSLASRPFLKALDALNYVRKSELRYSVQILVLTAVALYLHSAGMVQAAINFLN